MKQLTISQAADKMSLTPAYVRALIRKGVLPSTQVPIAFESRVMKHMIEERDIDAFLEGTVRKTKRKDGRNKFVFYATPDEFELVCQALTVGSLQHIVETMHFANTLKTTRKKEDHDK